MGCRTYMSAEGFVVLAMVATVFAFVRAYRPRRLPVITYLYHYIQVSEDVDLTLSQYKTVPCYLALFILAEYA